MQRGKDGKQMNRVTLISVGTLKENYWKEAVAEYRKRLGAFCRFEEVNLREENIREEDNPAAVRAALEAEGERILRAIPEGAFTVALCVEGRSFDSPTLARLLGEGCDRCGRAVFIIGSSHGLSPVVKERADLRLSVSALTFPHQLMRPLLMEAIYRSFSILAGKKYHK